MDDNRIATAPRGATASVTEAAPAAESRNLDAHGVEGPEPVEYRDTNSRLRQQYLRATADIREAAAEGDADAERRARNQREQIANEFIRHNTPLAARGASPFMVKDGDGRQDHMQAALLGLWEAFTGTDPKKVDEVIVDDDGSVRPAVGWDPEKGTYATLATRHVAGAVRRSVRSGESVHAGISYSTFVQKPKVEAARRQLLDELGRTPTNVEIAKAAGVTIETVQACLTARPVSLDAPVTDDGSGTLADLIVPTADGLPSGGSATSERELLERVDDLAGLDLLVLLLKTGLCGGEPLTVNRTADKLCIGRGATNLAIRRYQAALETPRAEEVTAPPRSVTCPCGQSFTYDPAQEPQPQLTELELPSSDVPLSVWREQMREWTDASNEAYAHDMAAHETTLRAYWAEAHVAARAFASAHAQHA